MKVTIYQPLHPTFRVDEAVKEYDPSEYKIVYNTENDYGEATAKELADHFFEVTNLTTLPGYTGHSMSVGDIINVDGENLICIPFGWMPVVWADDRKDA